MLSRVKAGPYVPFPAYMGERVYMQEFFQKDGLPKNLTRWQNTVDAMLGDIKTSLPIYLMIDQAMVSPNTCHRREGLHVDGFWNISAHGGSGHGHGQSPRNGHRGHGGHCAGSAKETLLLAANRFGCIGYEGEFEHPEWKEGDRSSLDVSKFNKVVFEPCRVYGGDTMHMLHESVPIGEACERTVVRLNVPGVSLWENIH